MANLRRFQLRRTVTRHRAPARSLSLFSPAYAHYSYFSQHAPSIARTMYLPAAHAPRAAPTAARQNLCHGGRTCLYAISLPPNYATSMRDGTLSSTSAYTGRRASLGNLDALAADIRHTQPGALRLRAL